MDKNVRKKASSPLDLVSDTSKEKAKSFKSSAKDSFVSWENKKSKFNAKASFNKPKKKKVTAAARKRAFRKNQTQATSRNASYGFTSSARSKVSKSASNATTKTTATAWSISSSEDKSKFTFNDRPTSAFAKKQAFANAKKSQSQVDAFKASAKKENESKKTSYKSSKSSRAAMKKRNKIAAIRRARSASSISQDEDTDKNVFGVVSKGAKYGLKKGLRALFILMPKGPLLILAAIAIGAIMCILLPVIIVTSVFLMGGGAGAKITEFSALKEDQLEVEQIYSDMEEKNVRQFLENIESNKPGYDKYEVTGDEIGHNPWELAAFLTAKYGAYTAQEPNVIQALQTTLKSQYKLTYDEYTDSDGKKVLKVTLTTTPISELAKKWLTTNQYAHYEVLISTMGNSDAFGENGTINGGTGELGAWTFSEANASEAQKEIAWRAKNNKGTRAATAGYCAAWVSGIYEASGQGYPGGNAVDFWTKWKSSGSTSLTNIPLGAAVVSKPIQGMNAPWGHIGIYIGDGKIASNVGGVKIESVESFDKTFKCYGWVWPKGKALQKPTTSSANTLAGAMTTTASAYGGSSDPTAPVGSITADGSRVDNNSMGVAIPLNTPNRKDYLGKSVIISYGGRTVTAIINDFGYMGNGSRGLDLQPGVFKALDPTATTCQKWGLRTVSYKILN